MVVCLGDIKGIYSALLSGRLAYNEAANWAAAIMDVADSNALHFFPADADGNIWEAILFLSGIDIELSPGVYLHNNEDICLAYIKLLPSL